MRHLLSVREAAQVLGVCVNTLRNWDRLGKLKPTCRTVGGHRRYEADAVLVLAGAPENVKTCLTAVYASVSGHDQKADLERQVERLRCECVARGYDNIEMITDVGSGLNFAKRGLRRLLGLILRWQVTRIIVMHKDRLLRFGAEPVFEMCHIFGIEVIVVQPTPTDAMSTLAADVIELMTVFSARMHGSRSHKNRLKPC